MQGASYGQADARKGRVLFEGTFHQSGYNSSEVGTTAAASPIDVVGFSAFCFTKPNRLGIRGDAMKMIAIAAIAAMTSVAVSAEVLTNNDVVTLTKAGLGDDAIISKIKTSDASYDLTTSKLVALKNAGVSGPVIAAMLQAATPKPAALSLDAFDPMVPHATGVYVVREGEHRMERMDPTATNQAKTGGHIGHLMTLGISTMSIKAAIPGESSRVKVTSGQPTFYFFFDESNGAGAGSSTWASGTQAVVTSPSEFTLIHLMKKEGRREAQVGSKNIGGLKSGVMDHDRIDFDYQLVRPGVYRAAPRERLKPGEYGFIYAISGGGAEGAMTARIYDFAVL